MIPKFIATSPLVSSPLFLRFAVFPFGLKLDALSFLFVA
jgi:hypothetical protein